MVSKRLCRDKQYFLHLVKQRMLDISVIQEDWYTNLVVYFNDRLQEELV